MAHDLLDELRDIRALMEDGGLAPNDLIAAAMQRLPAEVDATDLGRVRALRTEIVAIEKLAQQQKSLIGDELEKLTRGREMLKGYSALRPHTKAQRLSRKA